MSDSLKTIRVESHQYPLREFIQLTQEPIAKIFMKKYCEFAELKNDILFYFFVSGYWDLKKKELFCFYFSMEIT